MIWKKVLEDAKNGRIDELKKLMQKDGQDYDKFVERLEKFSGLPSAKKPKSQKVN